MSGVCSIDDCPPFYRDLTIECWDNDPWRRPSFKQILERLGCTVPPTFCAGSPYIIERYSTILLLEITLLSLKVPFTIKQMCSVRVEPGDIIYLEQGERKPESNKDIRNIKCWHKGSPLTLPSDYLQNQCEAIKFEGLSLLRDVLTYTKTINGSCSFLFIRHMFCSEYYHNVYQDKGGYLRPRLSTSSERSISFSNSSPVNSNNLSSGSGSPTNRYAGLHIWEGEYQTPCISLWHKR